MEKIVNRKILVIGVLFLFLGASALLGVSASYTNGQQQNIQVVQKNPNAKTGLTDDYKISTNTGNDYHPRVATNSQGQLIVVYEQEVDQFTKQVPVVYSSDNGKTWSSKIYFDSTSWTDGSGILAYPDIAYNAHNNTLFIDMVDPNGDMYNTAMTIISADIANVANASVYRISGTGSSAYTYCAGATTDNFYMSLTTVDYTGYTQTAELGYWTTPAFAHPNGGAKYGFYYDGGSNIKISPYSQIEMGSNDNRIFIVGESGADTSGQHVFIKSQVNDETLLTSGEQQNGMDKYGDVEQMPAEMLTFGTDPDVSGSGANVCVVYVTGGNVVCSYSTCDAHTYAPGFNWQYSTVDTGASTPSVYMTGSTVYCAYVKGGNLYLKTSTDAGATWGAAEQRTQGGTVISDPGSVAVSKLGIIFQDTRDGASHIYCSPIAPIAGPSVPTITGPASGKTGTSTDYVFTTTDPKGGQVFYYIDWGDGQNSGWVGPYASGATQTVSHTWATKGSYTIKAKAKDTGGHESEYGTLPITMPMTMTPPFLQFLEKLFERFPNAFPVLRQLLGY